MNDIEAGIAKLLGAIVAIKSAEYETMERIARKIQRDAQDKYGEYQSAVGPYPAWTPLTDATKKERADSGQTEDNPLLISGEVRDSIQIYVEPNEAVVGSDNPVFLYDEVGTTGGGWGGKAGPVPPRPTLGPAAYQNGHEAAHIYAKGIFDALTGRSAGGVDD